MIEAVGFQSPPLYLNASSTRLPPLPRHRQHGIHRWLQLDLPVLAVVALAQLEDAAQVDGVAAVDLEEAEGLEEGGELGEAAAVAQGMLAAQARQRVAAVSLQGVDVRRVDRPPDDPRAVVPRAWIQVEQDTVERRGGILSQMSIYGTSC